MSPADGHAHISARHGGAACVIAHWIEAISDVHPVIGHLSGAGNNQGAQKSTLPDLLPSLGEICGEVCPTACLHDDNTLMYHQIAMYHCVVHVKTLIKESVGQNHIGQNPSRQNPNSQNPNSQNHSNNMAK